MILPGSKLWLKPYKMARGAIHMNIDAMKNFFTTAAIVISSNLQIKLAAIHT